MKYALALSLVSTLLVSTAPAAAKSASELFAKPVETFQIQNTKGETPTFRVLSDSMTKQALAMAAIGMLNAQDEVKPKIAVTPYVDLKFQTLTMTLQGSDTIRLKLRLSGYSVDIDQTVSKKELLSGKTINIRYPKTEKEVAMYTIDSSGLLKLHLDKQTLILENVEANLSFESPLGDDGSEAIHFSGQGKRLL